jgi:hypothetical protein
MASSVGHLDAATQQLSAALSQVEGHPVDLNAAPWVEIEKGVIKLLHGPYRPDLPEHQLVALGLAGALANRLVSSDQAFWFPHREAPEGGMLGFPEALLMLSPLQAVVEALSRAKLERLEAVTADVRRALGEARFAPTAGAPVRLRPEDYARLFDPGFLQFGLLDKRRAQELWSARPSALSADVRAALARVSPQRMPTEARSQFEQQIAGSLARLDPARSFGDQVAISPRLAELMLALVAITKQTGSAPDEFWEDAALPFLFTGAPSSFPPLDVQDLEAARQGVEPLALFLDTVPYTTPAPEDGLLGIFPLGQVGLPHPGLGQGGMPRLLTVPRSALQSVVEKFDPRAARSALDGFVSYLRQKAGQPVAATPQGKQMEDAALALLGELKALLQGAPADAELVLRRLTETEALSDGALMAVREALQGPRIILTS